MPAQAGSAAAAAPFAPATQAPIAPAFGVAAPYPTLSSASGAVAAQPVAPAISFPPVVQTPVAPTPVSGPPVLPDLPRAPELIGADELAAPPRTPPPLNEPAPAGYDVQPTLGAPAFGTAAQLPPTQLAPTSLPPTQGAPTYSPSPSTSSSAPAAPGPIPTVAPAAAPTAAAGQASTQTSAPRAPLDFSSLLSTPVGADSNARAASAPLSFASTDHEDEQRDLARSTTGEKIGLALAVLVAPIGLIVGIIAAARSAGRRGWVVGIVRASIAIAAVLTVVLGIGGYYGYTQFKQQQLHDQTAAASAAFCAAIKADPSMDQLPTLGWPAVAASISDSLKDMQAYEDRFTKLAKVSPAGIKPGVTRVAAAAKKIIDAVKVARIVDDASNVATMSAVASSSGIPDWHSEYCG